MLIKQYTIICGHGGIGRRAGLRILFFGVGVQVPLSAVLIIRRFSYTLSFLAAAENVELLSKLT